MQTDVDYGTVAPQQQQSAAASSQGHLVVLPDDQPDFTSELERLTAADLRLLVSENVGINPGADAEKATMVQMLMTSSGFATVKQMRYLRDLIRKKERGSIRPFTVDEIRSKRHASAAIEAFKSMPDRR